MVERMEMQRGGLAAAVAALQDGLAEAEAALRGGDAVEAERRAKAVSALVKAAREVAELEAQARAQAPEEDADALRAELRRRICRLAEAQRAGVPDAVLERIATGELGS